MLVCLSDFSVVAPETLTLPDGFLPVLQESLCNIDECHEDMELSHVFLFGSTARGEGRAGKSDLDLLLLTRAESEKRVRLLVLQHDLDDDIGDVPVQVTVRRTSRFLDETEDVCGFHNSIAKDLKLLRRYEGDEL